MLSTIVEHNEDNKHSVASAAMPLWIASTSASGAVPHPELLYIFGIVLVQTACIASAVWGVRDNRLRCSILAP